MKLRLLSPLPVLALASTAFAGESATTTPALTNNGPEALAGIRPILDIRTRYEFREEGDLDPSHALTSRARAGLTTAEWNGWSALAEMEATHAFVDDYKSNPTGSNATQPFVTGNTVIFDPENYELNRAYLQ